MSELSPDKSHSLARAAELLRRYASVVKDCHSHELERFDYLPEIEDCAAAVEEAALSHARQSGERITPAELEHLIEWHDNCAKFSVQSDNFVGEEHHQARAAKLRKVDDLLCDIGARSAPSTTARKPTAWMCEDQYGDYMFSLNEKHDRDHGGSWSKVTPLYADPLPDSALVLPLRIANMELQRSLETSHAAAIASDKAYCKLAAELETALSATPCISPELRSALEMLAALADADDARTVEHGCTVPAVHHGDDSAVAWPENRLHKHLKPFLARTLRTTYITMRDAVAARDFLRRADGGKQTDG